MANWRTCASISSAGLFPCGTKVFSTDTGPLAVGLSSGYLSSGSIATDATEFLKKYIQSAFRICTYKFQDYRYMLRKVHVSTIPNTEYALYISEVYSTYRARPCQIQSELQFLTC